MKKWLILMLLAGQAACTSETNQTAASAPVAQSASAASEVVQAASAVAASAAVPASEVAQTMPVGDMAALIKLLKTFEDEVAQNSQQAASVQDPAQVQAAALKELAFFKQQTARLRDLKLDGQAATLRDKMTQSRELSAGAIEALLTNPQAKNDTRYATQLADAERLQNEVWQALEAWHKTTAK